jgi:hypothetical protein
LWRTLKRRLCPIQEIASYPGDCVLSRRSKSIQITSYPRGHVLSRIWHSSPECNIVFRGEILTRTWSQCSRTCIPLPRCSESCLIPLLPSLAPHYGPDSALDGHTVLGGTESGAVTDTWKRFSRAPSAWQKPKVSVVYQHNLTVRVIGMSSTPSREILSACQRKSLRL